MADDLGGWWTQRTESDASISEPAGVPPEYLTVRDPAGQPVSPRVLLGGKKEVAS